MNCRRIHIFLIFAFVGYFRNVNCQDVEKLVKGEIITMNGFASLNQMYFYNDGNWNSRKPYTYVFMGQLNTKLFDLIDMPVGFVFSNMGNRFTQPNFNQLALHPTYKWITLNLGRINSNFSPYTVNGHLYEGLSLELTPGKWQFEFLKGKFQNASLPDFSTSNSNLTSTFKRIGIGGKMGVNYSAGNTLSISVFHAKDDIGSLPDIPEISGLQPKENLTIGVSGTTKLAKWVSLSADWGNSSFTMDTRAQRVNTGKWQAEMFPSRTSTSFLNAVKASVQFGIRSQLINFKYERVDPGYRTLGAYYFVNDIENFTIGMHSTLFRNKLNLQAQGGYQRDNLDGKKLCRTKRVVGSLNMAGQIKKSSIVLGYSNFQTYTNLRSNSEINNSGNPYIYWDTLNYRQITQSATAMANIPLNKGSKSTTSLGFNVVYQDNRELQYRHGPITSFYQVAVNLIIQWPKRNANLGITGAWANTNISGNSIQAISPVLTLSKLCLNKKVKCSGSFCFTQTRRLGQISGDVYNARFQTSYNFNKVSDIALTAWYLRRNQFANSSNIQVANSNSTFTVMLNYSVKLVSPVGNRK